MPADLVKRTCIKKASAKRCMIRCQDLRLPISGCRHRFLSGGSAARQLSTVSHATSRSLPALVFSGLSGEWSLHRRIDSAMPSNPSGDVYGMATFTSTSSPATRSAVEPVAVGAAVTALPSQANSNHAPTAELEAGARTAVSPLALDGGLDADIDIDGTCPLFRAPAPTGDLLYGEQGEFRTDGGARFRVRRQYVYGYSPESDQVDVFFAAAGGARDYHFHTMRFDTDTGEGSGRFLEGLDLGCAGFSVDEPVRMYYSGASAGVGNGAASASSATSLSSWTGCVGASSADGPSAGGGTADGIAANNIVASTFLFSPDAQGGEGGALAGIRAGNDSGSGINGDVGEGRALVSASLSTAEFADECGGPWWWATAKGEHPCDEDMHLVSYRFDFRGMCLAAWRVTYEVKGPLVDYVASASYHRPNVVRGRRAP